jgi:DNA-binding transcriptional LysR family regulator
VREVCAAAPDRSATGSSKLCFDLVVNQAQEPVTDLDALDPRRLLIFREAARRGSLSAAAAALGWTQPAVGQHIQRLERDLGLALALRSTRGITLTEAGTRLLSHADAVASRLAAAGQEMDALRTLRTGRLRLTAFPSAAATLIPPALARLAAVAPGLDVWLTELEPPEALAAVLAGDVDLAVLFHHPGAQGSDRHPDLVIDILGDDPVRAVLPAHHRLATPGRIRTPLNLADLARERWIAGCLRCRTHLQALARTAGFEPDIRHTTDDYVVAQNLVAAGLAVALLPALALAAAPNPHVATVPISGNPARQISLAHRKEVTAVPAVTAAVHALSTSRDGYRLASQAGSA